MYVDIVYKLVIFQSQMRAIQMGYVQKEGTYIFPMPLRIQPIRKLETLCMFCGMQRVVFHQKIPAFLVGLNFSRQKID